MSFFLRRSLIISTPQTLGQFFSLQISVSFLCQNASPTELHLLFNQFQYNKNRLFAFASNPPHVDSYSRPLLCRTKKNHCSIGFSPPPPPIASPTSAYPPVAKKLCCSACFSPMPIASPTHSITRESLRNHLIHPKHLILRVIERGKHGLTLEVEMEVF